MYVLEDDETREGKIMLIGGVPVPGLVQVRLGGRSNYCQITNSQSKCRGLEPWLSGLHEPCLCSEKGVLRSIGMERKYKRMRESD